MLPRPLYPLSSPVAADLSLLIAFSCCERENAALSPRTLRRGRILCINEQLAAGSTPGESSRWASMSLMLSRDVHPS